MISSGDLIIGYQGCLVITKAIMLNNRRCKLCKEPVPCAAIYALNKVAIEAGFCSWYCCVLKVGNVKSRDMVKEYVKSDNRGI